MSAVTNGSRDGQMAVLQVNHVWLAYETIGRGDPVVLVHGGWGDHSVWDQLAPLLARHRRVITYDRRGYSSSDRPPGPRRIKDHDVEDLAGLIARVASGAAHVVGNSLGASIALRLAALHPELVRSVSAHEPLLFPLLEGASLAALTDREAMLGSIDAAMELIEEGRHEDAAYLFMENFAFGPGAWEQLPEPLRDICVSNAPAFSDEQGDPDWAALELPRLAATTTPLQLTYGSDTMPAFREIVEVLASRLPGAQRQAVDGAGHVPQLTHPAQLAQLLEAFWANATTRQGQLA
jgi:pimeloyl-ACP methyl ester carboxylesterase